MVPMLTCGLLRSNFSFAILNLPENLPCYLALGFADDLFRDRPRHFFVLTEVHRERTPTLCSGAHFRRVSEHLAQRNHGLDDVGASEQLRTFQTSAAADQVAVNRTHIFFG